MKKRKGSFIDSLFFLIGAFLYSFFYWATGHNIAHALGIIAIALVCYVLYKLEYGKNSRSEWIKPSHVICMCAGAVFDSLSYGFPFGILPV